MITNPIFAVSMGEPAGISGELLEKAWKALRSQQRFSFFVVAHETWLTQSCHVPFQAIQSSHEAREIFPNALPYLPLKQGLETPLVLGTLHTANTRMAIASLEEAYALTAQTKAHGLVTLPVHKKAMLDAGFLWVGHTDFLESMSGKKAVMLFVAREVQKPLFVVPLTVHVPLMEVSAKITTEKILSTAALLLHALQTQYGIVKPRLAISGLNPHAGEDGALGKEEQEIIIPAIAALQKMGLDVQGPFAADTLFSSQKRAFFDAFLCMFHDQALLPIKTLHEAKCVNVTIGTGMIRTSPDHGTALAIAGKNQADSQSFLCALEEAYNLYMYKI